LARDELLVVKMAGWKDRRWKDGRWRDKRWRDGGIEDGKGAGTVGPSLNLSIE
jgi:hypothetical protein